MWVGGWVGGREEAPKGRACVVSSWRRRGLLGGASPSSFSFFFLFLCRREALRCRRTERRPGEVGGWVGWVGWVGGWLGWVRWGGLSSHPLEGWVGGWVGGRTCT